MNGVPQLPVEFVVNCAGNNVLPDKNALSKPRLQKVIIVKILRKNSSNMPHVPLFVAARK